MWTFSKLCDNIWLKWRGRRRKLSEKDWKLYAGKESRSLESENCDTTEHKKDMSKFEAIQRDSGITTEPQLTSFTGVGDVEKIRFTGLGRDHCITVSVFHSLVTLYLFQCLFIYLISVQAWIESIQLVRWSSLIPLFLRRRPTCTAFHHITFVPTSTPLPLPPPPTSSS